LQETTFKRLYAAFRMRRYLSLDIGFRMSMMISRTATIMQTLITENEIPQY